MAKNRGERIEKNSHLFSMLFPLFVGLMLLFLVSLKLQVSVSADEAEAAYLTKGSWLDIIGFSANQPLYYIVLKIWSAVFGTTDVAMRFMSVFFGFVTIIFIFQIIKKSFGTKVAALGTVFAAALPVFIKSAQTMQPPMMALMVVAAATFCLMYCLENKKYWFFYAVLVVLGLLTHISTLPIFMVQLALVIKPFDKKSKVIFWLLILAIVLAVINNILFGDIYIIYSVVTIWALLGVTIVLMKNVALKAMMSVAVIAVTGFGVVLNLNSKPEGHITEILSETFIGAEEGQPILISNADDYLEAIFYNNAKYPIYAFSDILDGARNEEMINRYHINIIDNKDEFLAQHENVWYIMPKPEEGKEYEIPEWAKDLRVTSEISLNYHAALRFSSGE